MRKKNAIEILTYMEQLLLRYLKDLEGCSATDKDLFAYGEKTAYTECLEIIQQWEFSSLQETFSIEKHFPLWPT